MRRHSVALAIVTTVVFARVGVAQDFSLQVGPPIAGGSQQAKKSFLVVRPGGCPDPASARISATAEGLVDGVRRSMPLQLSTLPMPGVHGVSSEWPNGGYWIINLVGTCGEKTAGAIVSVGTNPAYRRESVKLLAHRPTPAEIEASLKALTPGGK